MNPSKTEIATALAAVDKWLSGQRRTRPELVQVGVLMLAARMALELPVPEKKEEKKIVTEPARELPAGVSDSQRRDEWSPSFRYFREYWLTHDPTWRVLGGFQASAEREIASQTNEIRTRV